jgi:hypothetical protein
MSSRIVPIRTEKLRLPGSGLDAAQGVLNGLLGSAVLWGVIWVIWRLCR